MITRAEIENELAKWDTQAKQLLHLRNYIKANLPARPVVNGPLAEFLNTEQISLEDFLVSELKTYRNWIT